MVVVAIEISDPALADRLASLLGGVTGIRLATPGEAAAVVLVSREAQAVVEPADIELTPRAWRRASGCYVLVYNPRGGGYLLQESGSEPLPLARQMS